MNGSKQFSNTFDRAEDSVSYDDSYENQQIGSDGTPHAEYKWGAILPD